VARLGGVFVFPKSSRLLRADEFTAVLRAPEVNLSAGPLRMRARKNRMRCARLGLVVTKKGTPKAHRRNRVKRIIRERFRQQAHVLPSIDVVVQVFAQIEDGELVANVDRMLTRLMEDTPK